jgi:tetratricopeptide (TPR) repeat protein
MSELSILAKALLAVNGEAFTATAAGRLDQLRRMAPLALQLGVVLRGDLRRFAELSLEVGVTELAECLLDLPLSLANAHETTSALAVARAFEFIAPDKLRGDSAVILAQANRRDEAVAKVAKNLEQAEDVALAEAKAGDAYRALGEADSAEAYYRRSLSESKTPFERSEAVLRIVSLLSDSGREQDAARFLAEERARSQKP